VRYEITGVFREESALREATWRMGWRLVATNQPAEELPFDEAIRLYRKAPRIERQFHLLNDAPVGIEPLFVRLDDQIKGLTRLLSLCVRLLTLLEIVARRNLAEQKETLEGLYEGNPRQSTDQPTAPRLLKAFGHIDRVFLPLEGRILCYLTPLSPLQRKILSMLELDERIYLDLLQNSA
jgi:transposase